MNSKEKAILKKLLTLIEESNDADLRGQLIGQYDHFICAVNSRIQFESQRVSNKKPELITE